MRAPFTTVSHWGIFSHSQEKGILLLFILEGTTTGSFLSSAKARIDKNYFTTQPQTDDNKEVIRCQHYLPNIWKMEGTSSVPEALYQGKK